MFLNYGVLGSLGLGSRAIRTKDPRGFGRHRHVWSGFARSGNPSTDCGTNRDDAVQPGQRPLVQVLPGSLRRLRAKASRVTRKRAPSPKTYMLVKAQEAATESMATNMEREMQGTRLEAESERGAKTREIQGDRRTGTKDCDTRLQLHKFYKLSILIFGRQALRAAAPRQILAQGNAGGGLKSKTLNKTTQTTTTCPRHERRTAVEIVEELEGTLRGNV